MVNTTQSDTIQYLSQIPLTVRQLVDQFHDAGFEAYIVGGCVRDLLMVKLLLIGMWLLMLIPNKLPRFSLTVIAIINLAPLLSEWVFPIIPIIWK